MQKATASKIMGRYLTDTDFRGSMDVVFIKHSDGRHDCFDGSDKLWLFLSRIYHLSVGVLYILYDGNICSEPCEIP